MDWHCILGDVGKEVMGRLGRDNPPPLGRYAFNFRQKVKRRPCPFLVRACCLLFAVCCLRLGDGNPPTCPPSSRARNPSSTNPASHPTISIPKKSKKEKEPFTSINPIPVAKTPLSYFQAASHSTNSTNSLLPLPPLNLPLPRRPEQLILHLGHLHVLHAGWNIRLFLVEHPRDPR
jgi:hypothetical protein